jgi:hypothetical protein
VVVGLEFESNFTFKTHLPPPDPFIPFVKTYPSRNTRHRGGASSKCFVFIYAYRHCAWEVFQLGIDRKFLLTE